MIVFNMFVLFIWIKQILIAGRKLVEKIRVDKSQRYSSDVDTLLALESFLSMLTVLGI